MYGWLLYEQAAVADTAHHFGKTVVVASQTIGPLLYGADRDISGSMLSCAALVGAPEAIKPQTRLRPEGNVVAPGLDDASFLATGAPLGKCESTGTYLRELAPWETSPGARVPATRAWCRSRGVGTED